MNVHRSEELIKEYHRQLKASGVSPQLAGRRRDKLRFFLHAYLAEEWPRDLDSVDGEIIRDFLGSWVLRHVGGAKSDLIAWLETFRHFYDHLYHTGRIAVPEYEELEMLLESETFFLQRYDDYFSPLVEGWDDWAACRRPPDHTDLIWGDYPGIIDRQLWIIVKNLETDPPPAVLDFDLFLDYLAGFQIKLDRSRKQIPRRHLKQINQRFSQPERPTAGDDMDAYRRITWFYQVALGLELAVVSDKGELTATARTEAFLDLDPDTQLSVLIDATWNAVSWADLGSQDMHQVSEWAQRHRDGFAALLADFTPNHDCRLDPDSELDRNDVLLARYIYFHDVVETVILFALSETGIITSTFWNDPDNRTLDIKSLATTRLGRQIMKLYARRAFQAATPSSTPLQRLQQSLLSY